MQDFKKHARNTGRAVWGEGKVSSEGSPAPLIFENGATWGAEEALKWAMSLCSTGCTPGMIRRILHNRVVELTGQGEKA